MGWSGYVPLIVALLTALLGVLAYAYQKWVDRRNALVELRRTAYQELLTSLQLYLRDRSTDSFSGLDEARAKITLVASDKVAKAVGAFFNAAIKSSNVVFPKGDEVLVSYAAMVIAMRADCFERTTLTEDQVVDIAPVMWRGK